jgi:hypothetical protein
MELSLLIRVQSKLRAFSQSETTTLSLVGKGAMGHSS